MKYLFRLSIMLILSLLSFTSCKTAEITATPAVQSLPTATQSAALGDQMNLLATQTQVAALNETAVAAQTTPIPNVQPLQSQYTPLPAAALPETIGPFQQVSREEALIADRVTGLKAAGDGSISLLSEGGYSVYKDDHWTGVFTELMGDLIGIDQSGRVWVASQDGTQISAWDGEEWVVYGVDEGWAQVPNPQGNPVSTGIIEDGVGNLWLATDADVRRFDGRGWQVFSPEAMGMPPRKEDLTSTYTLSLIESRGEVWAGRCDWGGPGPLGGGGARRFDGQAWHDVGLPLSTACVTALLVDSSGDVWVGADSNLYRNRLGSETWDTVALPNPPAESRFGYIATLTPDPAGRLWAALALCGGASCYGGEAYYFLDGDSWNPVGEPSQFGGSRFLFDGSGNSWVLAGSSIYQVIANQLVPVDGLLVQGATTDPAGNLWMVAQSSGPPTLWTLSPGQ